MKDGLFHLGNSAGYGFNDLSYTSVCKLGHFIKFPIKYKPSSCYQNWTHWTKNDLALLYIGYQWQEDYKCPFLLTRAKTASIFTYIKLEKQTYFKPWFITKYSNEIYYNKFKNEKCF